MAEHQKNPAAELSIVGQEKVGETARPRPELMAAERDEVKNAARELLAGVRAALVIDWRRKARARARVREAIADALDEGLLRVDSPDLYKQKVSAVFEHVYERFGVV